MSELVAFTERGRCLAKCSIGSWAGVSIWMFECRDLGVNLINFRKIER